jgi:dihydrofolate synthase/folylpolyglutamate synthase
MTLTCKTSPPSSTFTDAIDNLLKLKAFGIRLDLKEFNILLDSLDNPQRALKTILVGGTNGKGSTCAMLSSILLKSGYKVGLYTSPHLERFTERIKVNRNEIPEFEFARIYDKVANAIRMRHLKITLFEFITAMAFIYFEENDVDIAVLEVGLGGRLDATNIVDPIVSVITNVHKDHEDYLGKNLLQIGREKGGIIKEGGVLVTGVKDKGVLKLFAKSCNEMNSDLNVLGKEFTLKEGDVDFSYYGKNITINMLRTNLKGKHQYINASLAIAALEVLIENHYAIGVEAIKKGLVDIFWPGRLELIDGHILSRKVTGLSPSYKGRVLFDCAHNPAGIEILTKFLLSEIEYDRLILIIGILKDKDVGMISSLIGPVASQIITTAPDDERAASSKELLKEMRKYNERVKSVESVKDACLEGLSLMKENDLMCITGSIVVVGEARKTLVGSC